MPTLQGRTGENLRPAAQFEVRVLALSRRSRTPDVVLQLSAREGLHQAAVSRPDRGTSTKREKHQLLELWSAGRSGEGHGLRALQLSAFDAGCWPGRKTGCCVAR